MTLADIAVFLEAAERCRRLAAEAADPIEKQELLYIADGWLTLILSAEWAMPLIGLA